MNGVKIHNISKSELAKLNEDDLMFITNPGRMGDEDGSTFIVKHGKELIIYRVDGLLYSKEVNILLSDIEKQFPKWFDAWKNSTKKEYKGKYKYLYMGFGNGLCVDNSIFNEYEPYLESLVKEYLLNNCAEAKESLKYAAIFNVWKEAFIKMANDKGYVLKSNFFSVVKENK